MNFHRLLRPDSESLVSTTGFATETVVLRPSTRAPRRPSPWGKPVVVVVLFLSRHSAHENRRRDRRLRDTVENGREQVPRHGDLGQLERHVLRVPRHLGPDLDQLFTQRRQRPVPDQLRQGRRMSNVTELHVHTGQSTGTSRTDDSRRLCGSLTEGMGVRYPRRDQKEGPLAGGPLKQRKRMHGAIWLA